MKKGRYIVTKTKNIVQGNEYDMSGYICISYDVNFEGEDGFEFVAEFVCKSDAEKFKKLKNTELERKGLYKFNIYS